MNTARHLRRRTAASESPRDLVPKEDAISESEAGVPVRGLICGYMSNILRRYELSDRLMELVLFLMNIEERRDLVAFIYGPDIGHREEWLREATNYNSVLQHIFRPDCMDSVLLEDIYSGTLSTPREEVLSRLSRFLRERHKQLVARYGAAFRSRMAELGRVFSLDQTDLGLLVFLYCHYDTNVSSFENLSNEFTFHEFLSFCAAATDTAYPEVRRRLGFAGALYTTGILIEIDTRRSNFFRIEDSIRDFMAGMSEKTLVEKSVRRDTGERLELDRFTIPREKVGIIVSLLKSGKPCSILLHGAAGTGKTEFARAVAAAAGREAYFVKMSESLKDLDDAGKASDAGGRLIALRVAVNAVAPERGILVVDEADFILNTRAAFRSVSSATEKGWLNGLLDSCPAAVLWISNETESMEESTLRRFAYNLHFPEFTDRERKRVWENRLKGHPFAPVFTRGMIRRFSLEYRVNAGAIASVLDSLIRLHAGQTVKRRELERTVRELLSRHEELVKGSFRSGREPEVVPLADQYDVTVLNTSVPASTLGTGLGGFVKKWTRGPEGRGGINILFWGPPGTGKTEFAKYLARSLGVELMVKRSSDLESMWVGMTEKNISAAFREAARAKAILFIDEADSFFTARANAFRSWEVSRTNEFLTQMENHSGILICCTNLLPSMDRAAMRRFTWKIEFGPLRNDDKVGLYVKYFRGKDPLTPEQKLRIASIGGLTPGDLKAVWQRYRYVSKCEMDHEHIIGELENEITYRDTTNNGKIGF